MLWPAAILALCAGASVASAQEWKLSTYISQQLLYSDNLLLSRDRKIDAFGSITAPGVKIERNSPTSSIVLDGRFEFAEYLDHSEFNSQDQFINLGIEKLLSERATVRLDANFTRDTTLKSEQDVNGRFLDDAFRFISWRVGPSFTYQLSPIDELTLSSSYRNVNYDTNEKVDFQYFGPTIEYGHQLTELAQITTSLSAFRFIPDEAGNDHTDTVGLLLGYTYTPSETFSIGGAAGVGYSMREEDDPGSDDRDTNDVNYRLRFNLKYILSDQLTTRASISHDTEPSGDGDQVIRNRASVGLSYRVTELTSLGVNADYSDNEDILGFEGGSTSDDDETSRYFSVRPGVTWQLTEDLNLVAEYRYRHRVFDEENDSASSNSVYLTLQYNFPTVAGEGP